MDWNELKRAFSEEQKRNPFEYLYETIFSVLQQAIVTEKLPSGTHLKDSDIAQALQLSRTPVSRAFSLLEEGELLRPVTKGEYIIAPMTYKHLRKIMELRSTLEPPLCCIAAKSRTEDDLKKIRDLINNYRSLPLNKMNKDEITIASFHAETSFFKVICEICPNEYITQAYKNCLPQINRSIYFITKYCYSPIFNRPADDFIRGVLPVYDSIKAKNGYMAMDAVYAYIRRIDIRDINFLDRESE